MAFLVEQYTTSAFGSTSAFPVKEGFAVSIFGPILKPNIIMEDVSIASTYSDLIIDGFTEPLSGTIQFFTQYGHPNMVFSLFDTSGNLVAASDAIEDPGTFSINSQGDFTVSGTCSVSEILDLGDVFTFILSATDTSNLLVQDIISSMLSPDITYYGQAINTNPGFFEVKIFSTSAFDELVAFTADDLSISSLSTSAQTPADLVFGFGTIYMGYIENLIPTSNIKFQFSTGTRYITSGHLDNSDIYWVKNAISFE